jgi:exonuclease SbcC
MAESLTNLLKETKNKSSIVKEQIKDIEIQINTKTKQLNQLNEYLKEHQAILAYKEQYNEILDNAQTLNNQCSTLESEIDDCKFQIERYKKHKVDLLNEINKFNINELRKNIEELAKLEKEYNSLKSDLRNEDTKLNNQIKSVRKLDLVPCGESFPNCHYIKDSYEDKKTLESQKKLVEKLSQTVKTLNNNISNLLQIEANKKIKNIEKYQLDLNDVEIKLIKYEEKLKSATEILPLKIAEKEVNQKRLESIYSLLDKGIEETQQNVKTLNQELKYLTKNKNDLYMTVGSLKEKIDTYTQQKKECEEIFVKLKIYNTVLDAFSKNGIPALVLKNQLPLINNELEKITLGLNFKLTLETELNSNTLDIYIENNQPKRVIELCSGAEMAMASLAIRVALCAISSLPKCDILIIDEGFSSLDEENVPRVLQLLTLFKTYFKTILVVSHIPQIKEAAEKILEISNNGIESNIKFF